MLSSCPVLWLARFSHRRFFCAGKDKSVVLWSIQDHITTAGSNKTGGRSVGPRGVYHGHEDTVEDVAFCPSR